jgi:hypothetical protein
MVNQRNSKKTLEMIITCTQCGVPFLVAWALTFANGSQSKWKRCVGKEIASWISIPLILLGLYFELDLGSYFEEAYAWHNSTGPLNKRSGFRMLKIFDLYLGFEVPWWNSAVDGIDDLNNCKIPGMMEYLQKKFTGVQYNFQRKQILHGLRKGREELLKMTSRYYLRAMIILFLITHHEHGAPYFRAVLSDVYANQDISNEPLIHKSESSNWGQYLYTNCNNQCNHHPHEEVKWVNIVSNNSEDIVCWWRQFGLNRECCEKDLQCLSQENSPRIPLNESPLLVFKCKYTVLFECLNVVFGKMMSNSWLCG